MKMPNKGSLKCEGFWSFYFKTRCFASTLNLISPVFCSPSFGCTLKVKTQDGFFLDFASF